MNIRHYTAIAAVARTRSITRAAEELFVTQQGLSKTIREAEAEFGKPIFHRSRSGTILTADGEQLLAIIFPFLNEYEEVQNHVEMLSGAPGREKIRCGVAYGVMYSLGYDLVQDLQNALPDVFPEYEFLFFEMYDLDIEERMAEGSLDFAISLCPYRQKNLLYNSIYAEPLTVYLPEDHPLAGEHTLRLEQLNEERFSLMTRHMQFYESTIAACLNAGFHPDVAMECMDVFTALSYVASGGCVFLGMDRIFDMPKIARVPLKHPVLIWDEGLVYTKAGLKDRRRIRLLRFLSDWFRDRILMIRDPNQSRFPQLQ